MITLPELRKYRVNKTDVSQDINGKRNLAERILEDPGKIPYIFEIGSSFKLRQIAPYKNEGEGGLVVPSNKLIVSNFYQGFLRLKREADRDSVVSKVKFDPCGFGHVPIGDPSQEHPRVFLSVSVASKKREVGLRFTLIRGGCDERPSYEAGVIDNSEDILDMMEPYMSLGRRG